MKVSTVPEGAKQGAEIRDKPWMETLIWTERMVSALVNGVRGGKWFSLIDKVFAPKTLRLAWDKVKRNRGAAGVDGQSIKKFEANAENYLMELKEALEKGQYHPAAVKRVDIPKGDGKTRPLGIPTVKDRVVQTAVKMVVEPIFEHHFLPSSYGFRPGLGCKDALRAVDRLLKQGYTHVVDADIQGYFDNIPHERLMARVEEKISDGRLLGLIRSWLKQDVIQEMERWTPTKGTPQGAVISPLLANIYLHPLDERLKAKGYESVRYADDFVVLCQSPEDAAAALQDVQEWMAENGLTLHPDKTHVGNCMNRGEGFEFLGYRFERGRRWVRKKSLTKIKESIRAKTRRTRGESLERIIEDLNPMLKGWFEYFKHAGSTTFRDLDGMIRRRLRALLRQQEKRPGMGRCREDHKRWTNAFFAEAGLFALYAAWEKARYSRCGNY